MQTLPNVSRLPELGQVWGNPDTFKRFKARLRERSPQDWETLCSWFQGATRDRGYIVEIPENQDLDELLKGDTKLFGLTILFGNPEAVEAQVVYGPESYLIGGILMDFSSKPQFSVHT